MQSHLDIKNLEIFEIENITDLWKIFSGSDIGAQKLPVVN
jgi:hypothetical protein